MNCPLFTPPPPLSDPDLRALLTGTQSIAVVGLSPDPARESHGVARYLQAVGYRIVPVNPVVAASATPVLLGEPCYASLGEALQHRRFELVDVFRRSGHVPPLVDELLGLVHRRAHGGIRGLWLQEGVRHDAAAASAVAAGLQVVQDSCILVQHRRLFRT